MTTRVRLFPFLYCAVAYFLSLLGQSDCDHALAELGIVAVEDARAHQRYSKRSIPAISCPRDTYPFIVQGKVKECQPGNASSPCPEGFICYFDGIDRRYICCGKMTGYCEGGRPYLDADTSEPQSCKSSSSGACRSPYECVPKDSTSEDGYCCLNMNNIEPPPVGCPWGTRPLKDVNKQLIRCTPGMANACPGGAICYFDSVERTNRCCGRDPGEGCPSGTRALKSNNRVVPCLPGDPQQRCPDKAVCQWSYLIDRFQCCEADDGCPYDATPYFEPSGSAIRACRPDQQSLQSQPGPSLTASCPEEYTCEFNFWTVSYQCCGKKSDGGKSGHRREGGKDNYQTIALGPDDGQAALENLTPKERQALKLFCHTITFLNRTCSSLCPSGQIAYVETSNNMPRSCLVGQPISACPLGYTCQTSSTGQGLCCGVPGQCPAGSSPYTDTSGRLYSCSPAVPNSCLRPAMCQPVVGGTPGQYLCCTTLGGSGQCPAGYTMQGNQVVPCNPSSPVSCALGSSCVSSPSQPTLFLCCRFGGGPPVDSQYCPIGYRIQGNAPVFCSPSMVTSCAPGGQCLQSPTRPVFYCCATSYGVEASQCPSNYALQDGLLTQCSPSSPTCKAHSACLQSPSNPSLFICCSYAATPASPCPVGSVPQNNVVTTCTPLAPGACQVGSSCLQSSTNPGMYLCCTSSDDTGAQQCPVGFIRQDNRVTPCDPVTFRPCHSNSFCVSSTGGASSSYLCCTSTAGPSFFQCPANYSPQDGVPVQCSPQNPSLRCSPPAVCLGSPDQPSVSICCVASTASAGQCPSGYALQNNVVSQCSPSFSTCLGTSQCLASAANPSFFLCCTPTAAGGAATCPFGFSLPSPTPQVCTPGAGASSCPANSQCLQSQDQPGVYICCQPGGVSGQLQCPGNGQPATTGSSLTFCSLGATPSTCPTGYACQPATNAPGMAICCSAGGLAPTCPGGAAPVPLPTVSGHYAFCTLSSPNCPAGANCQTATNMVNTHVCCSSVGTSTAYACPHDYTPLVDPTGLVTFCSSGGGGACPPPSTCLQAANNPQFSICCQPFGQSAAQCPLPGSTPLYIAGVVQTCAGPSASCPQAGYSCQQSSSNFQYVCCSTGPPGGVQCANGQQIYQPGSVTFFCNPVLSQCPAQYDCLPSTLSGQHVCCGISNTSTSTLWQCVSGRQPFPNSQNPQTCSPTSGTTCPGGTSCELSSMPNQFICCASSAAQSKCPAGATAYLEGLAPRRCTGPSDLSCPAPYTCAPSDEPNVYICCRFEPSAGSLTIRCFSGAPSYAPPGSTEPQRCTIAAQNCPPSFSCQASTTPGVTICCGSVDTNALLCPDGTPALIQGTQPIICSNAGVACPPAFACVQTPSSPGVRICCAISGRGIGGLGGVDSPSISQVCGPGQQPYFLNNQPQTCQIGTAQSCADGYICQQGVAGVYYCCQGPRCPSGVTLLETNGHPRFCNPASNSCPMGANCQQSINLPGNYICCMISISQSPSLTRCIGRSTYMIPSGRPQMCTSSPTVCPPETECSSFTTTNEMVCCSTAPTAIEPSGTVSGAPPICPLGDPYRDPISKQYHFCSDTNYACPEGFVCKQAINNVGQYVCCSGKGTCQKSWIPYLERASNLPVQCSPFDKNACKPPGPPYKCQQSTKPGEYLCCMESVIAMSGGHRNALGYDNETTDYEMYRSSTLSLTTPGYRWRNEGG